MADAAMQAFAGPPSAGPPPASEPAAPWLAPTEEALCVFECACDAWTDYVRALATAAGPAAVVEANTRLALDSFDLCSRATGAYLAMHGLKAPLLSDA